MIRLINWHDVVKLEWAADRGREAPDWDAKAESFARWAERRGESGLVAAVLAFLAPAVGESFLDLGCGPGNLSLPLAQRKCPVTAVDASPAMLEALKLRAQREGCAIAAVEGNFLELATAGKLPVHDTVLSCRSLSVICCNRQHELQMVQGLEAMHALARRRVVIVFPSHSVALDPALRRRLQKAELAELWRGEQSIFQLLHQLDLMPWMHWLAHPVCHEWADADEGFAHTTRMTGLPASARPAFDAWLKERGRRTEQGWRLTLPGRTQVIGWDTVHQWRDGIREESHATLSRP